MLSSIVDRVTYTGNGSTSVYSYGCRVVAASDILATIRKISDGTETTLALTTDYTVGSIGQASGNITLVNASQAWLNGSGNLLSTYTLTIRRVRPLTQNTSLRNQGSFYAATHEDTFDNQMMISQQQEDEIGRSVKLSETTTPSQFSPTLPSGIALPANASRTLIVNATNNGWDLGPTTTQISAAATNAAAAAASAVAAASSATSSTASAAAAAASAATGGAAFVTGTRSVPQQITAAGGIAFTGNNPNNIWFIKGNGGAITVTKNPQIAAGNVVGQMLWLFGTDDTNTVTVQTGTGLDLNGTWVGGNASMLILIWDGITWTESSRR